MNELIRRLRQDAELRLPLEDDEAASVQKDCREAADALERMQKDAERYRRLRQWARQIARIHDKRPAVGRARR